MRLERFIGRRINSFVGRYQERLGIAQTRRLAKTYNRMRYRSLQRRHDEAYRLHLDELLDENEPNRRAKPANVITDGWAIDRSGDFPYVEEALTQANEIIESRGGQDLRGTPKAQQDFLSDLTAPPVNRRQDMERYPALLEFALSSEVLGTVAHYMESIPVLSRTRPPGLRLMESSNRYDEYADGPLRASQFYHRDIHDLPLVYVILLVRQVTSTSGPWCFLPKSVSERASKGLNYQARGEPYRVSDERMYEHVDPSESIQFSGKPGDVLFIDSSRCFHYGSRNADPPRYQLMYAYTTHARSDFSLMIQRPTDYPIRPGDSRLRRMVLGGIADH